MERSSKYSDRCSHILCLSGKLMSNIPAVCGHHGWFNANGGVQKHKPKKKKKGKKEIENRNRIVRK